jgi:hypothetical protein
MGGGVTVVAPWQGEGKPRRAENPREDRLQPHGLTARGRTNGLPVRLKPLKAGLELLHEEVEAERSQGRAGTATERGRKGETETARWTSPGSIEMVDKERQEGQWRREAATADEEGKPLKGKPQERSGMKQGRRVLGGRKRQEAEKA